VDEAPVFLRLAGHPVRWRLLVALARGDRQVHELTALVGEAQSLVSYHLGLLRAAGLVSVRRSAADGRVGYYHLDLARGRRAARRRRRARIRLAVFCVAFTVDHILSYGGFKYQAKLVVQPNPSMAPVLLLGGAFQDRYSWARHEARLAPLATTVTVDLPGAGDADPLPPEYGLEFLADAVRHTVTELGLPPLNVMGGSYGGAVAYRLAQRHPAAVRRLLLCGTALRIPESIRAHARAGIELFRAGDRDAFVHSTVELFLCTDPAATIHKRTAVARLLERQLRGLTPDQAEKYLWNTERVLACTSRDSGTAPRGRILFVTGEHDTLTTPAMCRETASGCPDARFTTVRHADHLLPLQRADEFADLMIRFFGDEPIDDLPYCEPIEAVGCGGGHERDIRSLRAVQLP